MFKEIFQEEVYVSHGITLKDGDTVFDVGANIGLFSLYLMNRDQNLTVYAFEPIPAIFAVLDKNLAAYGRNVKVLQCGLADREGEVTFNYYRNAPVFSSMADFDFDRNRLWSWTVDHWNDVVVKINPPARYIPRFLRPIALRYGTRRAFDKETVTCPIMTLSRFMRDRSIDRIDLLKLDAENCERQVLAGIDEADWPRIRQIAMEVHGHIDGGETLRDEIRSLLESKGFETSMGEEGVQTRFGLEMLYAIRAA